MSSISLLGVSSYLPEQVVNADFFASLNLSKKKHAMMQPPIQRRHVSPDESAVSMIEKASQKLINRLNLDPATDIDLILTNVSVPDEAFTGCGAVIAHRLGCPSPIILDLHNTGCVSFIYMINLAKTLLQSENARGALICNVQNSGGRIFSGSETRKKPQAAIPGDACGVAYVALSEQSPVIGCHHKSYPKYSRDMSVITEDGRHYWEPGMSQPYINFNQSKMLSIAMRGNRMVPGMVKELFAKKSMDLSEIDFLITNQPNRIFLRIWREALQLPKDKHPDTFDEYGNLFGAGIPVTLTEIQKNIPNDSLLVLSGFSHAGDYAAAAAVRWRNN